MVQNWSPKANAKLLLAVLEQLKCQNIKLDYKGLAEFMGPQCNARSVINQFTKLKKMAAEENKNRNNASASASGDGDAGAGASSTPAAPMKRKAAAAATAAPKAGGRTKKTKVKKEEVKEEDDTAGDEEGKEKSLGEVKEESEKIKEESEDSSVDWD
ncbi:hypothetical protein BDV12DRAFT_201152 [Aspergillus spectabilis]